MNQLIRCELFKVFRQKKLYMFMLILTAVEISALFQFHWEAAGYTGMGPNGQSFPLLVLNGSSLFIPVFIAVMAADSIAEEYRSGTLKKILLCPIRRMDLLHAKIASLLIVAAMLLLFLILSSYMTGTLAFGWGDRTFAEGTAYPSMEGMRLVGQTFLMSLLPNLAFGLVVMFVALLTMNTGASIGTALVLIAVSPLIEGVPQIRKLFIGYQMRVFPFHPLHHTAAAELGSGSAIILAYIVVLYAGSVMILRKKDILI
ncbi:ABC transporter permease [Paenibacillus sp. XY044]|uniref:ABC transporter permease n=1 Tax=Paenibacillus sp. XY044 TaxID=2026089 RepID=UPI000B97D69F|nr:ABC transporter permease [Paenibacillus sp. XY044]OZB96568.1 hypothetical protein CJP46_11885 [Paenibacillus sp. XY044]